MDRSRGTPAPSTLDFSPDGTGRNTQGDFADAQIGAPLRRLECDMGLPQGYLEIHERPSGRTDSRRDCEPQYRSRPDVHPQQQQHRYRPAPAPYYPEQQQYQAGPSMPNRYRFEQNTYDYKQQQYLDQRYRIDPRYQQQYMDSRYQQQYMDSRYQQQYRPQHQMDPRGYRPGNRFSGPGYSNGMYDSCNQGNTCAPPGVILRNGYAYPADYSNQQYDPMDPAGRFIPGNNQQSNYYRQQWWRNAQTPPGYENRLPYQQPYQIDQGQYYNDQYSDYNRQYQYRNQNQYDSRFYQNQSQPGYYEDQSGYQNQYDSRYQNQYDNSNQYSNFLQNQYEQFANQNEQMHLLAPAMQSMLGHSINDYDRSVPERLGCARTISALLEKTYGVPIRDQGCDGLESSIQNYGWVRINANDVQAGDVIVGHRQPGDYGHAAVYVGNNLIFNNNSISRRIVLESASKFAASEFVQVNVYRKVR